MANPHRGQVPLQVGGTTYTLCLSANALCELEDYTGETVGAITEKLNGSSVGMKTIRALVWAALQDHHPEVDIKAAGNIITLAGMNACMEAIGKAFEYAFPAAEASDRPTKARAE